MHWFPGMETHYEVRSEETGELLLYVHADFTARATRRAVEDAGIEVNVYLVRVDADGTRATVHD